MKRILMTGGTGFFGKSILDYLKRHPGFLPDVGWTILSRHPEAFVSRHADLLEGSRNIDFIAGDVRDFRFSGCCDAVIHAATAAVTTLADDEMTSTIVDGTRHVIEVARECGVGKILFTSSGAVYGPRTEAVDEDAACCPVTAYGKGKLEAERLLAESGLDVRIARCFAFVGPYLDRNIHYAIGNFIRDCWTGRPIVIQGDGTPLRSYLYSDDLVEWLFAVLAKGVCGRPYNIGSDAGISILELAETVRDALGRTNEIVVCGKVDPAVRPSAYVPSVSRAMRELDVSVTVPLAEAVRRSVLKI